MKDVRRVPDLRPGRGPLAGIEAGLEAACLPRVFVAAGDMPFVPDALIGFLLDRISGGASAAVPVYRGRSHPLCAAYDRRILSVVSSALDEGIGAVRTLLDILGNVEYVNEELLRFGDPELFLMNVNSPEDLDRARTALRGRSS
jgi:molybdopterin-guanine dinucleotide biosynthesis protein A